MGSEEFEEQLRQAMDAAEPDPPAADGARERVVAAMVEAVKAPTPGLWRRSWSQLAGHAEQREPRKRWAYALVVLLVIGVLVGGVLVAPDRHSGSSLLAQAAYAMGVSSTLHVRGDRNLGDEYWSVVDPVGSYEFWFSPEGFRQDWYNEEGELVRSLGGLVASDQAWQYFAGQPGESGSEYQYQLNPGEVAAYIEVNRARFANGQLRVAQIEERGHTWTEGNGEWQGKPVTVVTEDLTPIIVSGKERGTVEYYLDPQTDDLVGMACYGPATEGRPLLAAVDLIEYDVEISAGVFQPNAPEGTTVQDGQYAVRPSGDIAFYPSDSTAVQSLAVSAVEMSERAQMGVVPWEAAEQAYLNVLNEDPQNKDAREYLGRMYTRWGLFEEALDLLPSGDGYWGDLNRAFCLDALGQRQQAVALYEKLKDIGAGNSVAEWAKLGLQHPTWPRDLDVSPEPGEVRLQPQPQWRASASSAVAETTPQAAIDDDPVTRWSGGHSPNGDGQAPGQWFQVDFGAPIAVSRVLMDSWGPKSYVNDWPRGLTASYTADGSTWQPMAMTQAGAATPATVRFASPTQVRSIRFESTVQHNPEWWSIHELYVFGPAS